MGVRRVILSLLVLCLSIIFLTDDPRAQTSPPFMVRRVLLLSIDGLHAAPAGDTTLAGHGGFSEEDTHVALLVSNPGLGTRIIKSPVETTQIAPTILRALGIDPQGLEAVRMERTRTLPGLFEESNSQLRALTFK